MALKFGGAVWLLTTHEPAGRHASVRPALNEYYEMYRDVADDRNVHLLDLHAIWGDTPPSSNYMPDGIHTNSLAGRDVIAPAVISDFGL